MTDGRLWNGPDAGASDSSDRLLEQYKMYVEMADRVSARRGAANTYFLTLNTAVFALFGSLGAKLNSAPVVVLAVPLLALLTQCGAWLFLLRSYRQLNSAKYKVIGQMEERLPASPYWNAEWHELGEGIDRSRYWPLSHLEQWLPITFAILYVAAFVTACAV